MKMFRTLFIVAIATFMFSNAYAEPVSIDLSSANLTSNVLNFNYTFDVHQKADAPIPVKNSDEFQANDVITWLSNDNITHITGSQESGVSLFAFFMMFTKNDLQTVKPGLNIKQINNVQFGLSPNADDLSGKVTLLATMILEYKNGQVINQHQQNETNISTGWNTVELSTPFQISADMDSIFIGYLIGVMGPASPIGMQEPAHSKQNYLMQLNSEGQVVASSKYQSHSFCIKAGVSDGNSGGGNPTGGSFDKIPLLERFTEIDCGPCASYNNAGYSDWVNTNKNNLAIVTYHTWWPGGNDPMYHFDTSIARTRVQMYQSFYPFNGVPEVKFNGGAAANGMPNNTTLTQLLATEKAKKVPVKITPTIAFDNSNNANVKVEVFSESAISGVRLQVLIVQEMVEFASPPGSNGEKEFPFVARFALPNMNGENLTLSANQTIIREFTKDIRTVPQAGSFYVVAFLEETTSPHNIVQAGISSNTVAIHPLTIDVTQTALYSKVDNETDHNHAIIIKNNNAFDVKVSTQLEQEGHWTISNVPNTIDIPAGQTDTTIITVKSGANASGNLLSVSLKGAYNGANDGKIYANSENNTLFFAMTNNTKYAYLSGLGYSNYTISSMKKATKFNNQLVEVPMFGSLDLLNELCKTNLLDELDFFGMSLQTDYLIYSVYLGVNLISKIATIHNAGGKLYIESDMSYYYANSYKTQYPGPMTAPYNTLESLMKNCYGSWCNTTLRLNMNDGQYYTTLNATAKDTTVSKGENLTLNGQSPYSAYIDVLNQLEPNALPVYAATSGGTEYNLMTKFTKNEARSINSCINLCAFPPGKRDELANSIINWLFEGVGVIDLGPVGVFSIFPNPVKDHLTIDLKEDAKVSIWTIEGDLLYDSEHIEGVSTIKLNAASGTYILRTENKNGSHTTKFVVE